MQRIAYRCIYGMSSFILLLFARLGHANDMAGQDGMFVMAAIGDSITTGFNAKNPLDNKSLSWSTGYSTTERVQSHYRRAQNVFEGEVYQLNLAKAGARSDAIEAQMENVVKKLKGRELDYLTVMIGANDVCSWPADHGERLDQFSTRVRNTLDQALAQNPNVKITLVPVPDMLLLYELGAETKTCKARWKILNICAPLLQNNNADERAAFGQRVLDLNDSLSSIASEYPHAVHYAADVATFAFEKEDISGYDCFHPSWRGQDKIAEKSWTGGWYDAVP